MQNLVLRASFLNSNNLLRNGFNHKLKVFTLTMVASTQVSNLFSLFIGLVTIPLPLTHPNKIAFLNVGIAI
jgi:hypothetical protein